MLFPFWFFLTRQFNILFLDSNYASLVKAYSVTLPFYYNFPCPSSTCWCNCSKFPHSHSLVFTNSTHPPDNYEDDLTSSSSHPWLPINPHPDPVLPITLKLIGQIFNYDMIDYGLIIRYQRKRSLSLTSSYITATVSIVKQAVNVSNRIVQLFIYYDHRDLVDALSTETRFLETSRIADTIDILLSSSAMLTNGGGVFKTSSRDFWIMKSASRCGEISVARSFVESLQYVSEDFVDWFCLLET